MEGKRGVSCQKNAPPHHGMQGFWRQTALQACPFTLDYRLVQAEIVS